MCRPFLIFGNQYAASSFSQETVEQGRERTLKKFLQGGQKMSTYHKKYPSKSVHKALEIACFA